MIDEEWEKQRNRAILAAFQTGRPVFADSEGELRFVDETGERVPADVGVAKQPNPRVRAARAERASHYAFVTSIIAASASAICVFWHPWWLAPAVVFVGSAVVWRRVIRHQRAEVREEAP